eukprot:CCRYP_000292-RA/>CCRYP_000292-RA protein AED:0.42 eAED:0.42 QI:0/-1/0/1/-1/1/1/0/452
MTNFSLPRIDEDEPLLIMAIGRMHPSTIYPPTLRAEKKDALALNYSTLMDLLLKHRRNALALVGALVITMSIYNSSSTSNAYLDSTESIQRGLSEFRPSPFVMCERPTPLYKFMDDPTMEWSSEAPRTRTKLLLLKDPSISLGGSNNIGNQVNALLHAFDYARYNDMDLGLTMDSWAMKTIHHMFMQDFFSSITNAKAVTAATAIELLQNELGIKIITDDEQLRSYEVVESGSSQELLNYHPPSMLKDWKQIMRHHVFILQRLFRHYNGGNGFSINRSESSEMTFTKQMCMELHALFGDEMSRTLYTVIHTKDADLGAGDVAPTGSLITSEYLHAVLKELGMSKHPIVLLSDESTASQLVEEELKLDPTIALNLKVIYSHPDLSGPEAMVAILSSVYIGSPGSATSGFISRSRYALGFKGGTFMFNKDTLGKWKHECKEDCVFHPWVMQKLL